MEVEAMMEAIVKAMMETIVEAMMEAAVVGVGVEMGVAVDVTVAAEIKALNIFVKVVYVPTYYIFYKDNIIIKSKWSLIC